MGYVVLPEGASYNATTEGIDETELGIFPRGDFEKLLTTNHE